MDWIALLLSLKLAVATSLILFIISLPIAYWLVFSSFKWKFFFEAILALPLVLPPTVLGFYILILISPKGYLGKLFNQLFDSSFAFSFSGLLIASILYSLPFCMQPIITAFSSIEKTLVEASWCLGVSKLTTFFKLIIPLSLRGIISGILLAFIHTLGEFGVVLMVGGNIAGQTRTISISIYDDVQALQYERAENTALFMLISSFLVLTIIYSLQRKLPNRWTMN